MNINRTTLNGLVFAVGLVLGMLGFIGDVYSTTTAIILTAGTWFIGYALVNLFLEIVLQLADCEVSGDAGQYFFFLKWLCNEKFIQCMSASTQDTECRVVLFDLFDVNLNQCVDTVVFADDMNRDVVGCNSL